MPTVGAARELEVRSLRLQSLALVAMVVEPGVAVRWLDPLFDLIVRFGYERSSDNGCSVNRGGADLERFSLQSNRTNAPRRAMETRGDLTSFSSIQLQLQSSAFVARSCSVEQHMLSNLLASLSFAQTSSVSDLTQRRQGAKLFSALLGVFASLRDPSVCERLLGPVSV